MAPRRLPPAWLGLWLVILSALPACRSEPATPVKIFCWDLTPATVEVIRGLETGLGETLPVVTAAGSYETGAKLVRQLRRQNLKLLLVLGTPALILTAPEIKETPVVFAMVADPYQTGAAYHPDQPEDHQANITGLASPPPVAAAFENLLRLFPTKKHWGLIYDPADGSSQELRQLCLKEAATLGLTLTVISWRDQPSAPAAVQALMAQGVEVAFIPPDQAADRYAAELLAAGQNRRLLVVNGNPRLAGGGAVLSLTLDYEALGREAATLAKQVLAGKNPKSLPIQKAIPIRVSYNEDLLVRWLGYPPGRH